MIHFFAYICALLSMTDSITDTQLAYLNENLRAVDRYMVNMYIEAVPQGFGNFMLLDVTRNERQPDTVWVVITVVDETRRDLCQLKWQPILEFVNIYLDNHRTTHVLK